MKAKATEHFVNRKNEGHEEKAAVCGNSLDGLKMSVGTSEAQLGLRRDLGMVEGFAQNAEREYFYPSCFFDAYVRIYRSQGALGYIMWNGRKDPL